MPVFTIAGPDGKTYTVQARDEASALSGLKQQLAQQQPMGVAEDVARSAGAEAVRNTVGIAGLPGDLADLATAGAKWVGEKTGMPTSDEPRPSWIPNSQEAVQAFEQNVSGPLHQPQTEAGKWGKSIGGFLPAMIGGPAGLVRRGVSALAAGVASEAAGRATEGTAYEPWARTGAAVLGGGLAAPGKGTRTVPKKAPTQAELKAAGSGGYDTAFGMGVDFDTAAVAHLSSVKRAALDKKSFGPNSAPITYEVLGSLENRRGVVQLNDLDEAHKRLQAAATPSDKKAAGELKRAIEEFINDPPQGSVLAGNFQTGPEALAAYRQDFKKAYDLAVQRGVDPRTAGRAADTVARRSAAAAAQRFADENARRASAILHDARGDYAALERSKELRGREKIARWRALSSGVGWNYDNNARNRVTDVLRDNELHGKTHGFTEAERAQLEKFVEGTKPRNASRQVANKFGNAIAIGGGVGGAFYHPGMLAFPATGIAAKYNQNRLGRRAMQNLDEAIRMRSPEYARRRDTIESIESKRKAAALRMLLLSLQQQNSGGGGY